MLLELKNYREMVVPGEKIEVGNLTAGFGIYSENGNFYSMYLGIKSIKGSYISIIPLAGKYIPKKDDRVIGKIVDIAPTYWTVDINAPYFAPLHVNDVPWKVEFGDTARYLNIGDTILAKVSNVNEVKQVWITMKDHGLRKLEGGQLIKIPPTRVARVIGKRGSMINLIKESTQCRIYIGQNGVIWIHGEPENVMLAIKAIRLIEKEAHTLGLTDKVKNLLSSKGD